MEGERGAPCQARPLRVPLTAQLGSLWSPGRTRPDPLTPATAKSQHPQDRAPGAAREGSAGSHRAPRPWRRLDLSPPPALWFLGRFQLQRGGPRPPRSTPRVQDAATLCWGQPGVPQTQAGGRVAGGGCKTHPPAPQGTEFKQEQRKEAKEKTSLEVHWLRLHAPHARGTGSIPGQGTKIPTPQKKKKTESCGLSHLALPCEKRRCQNSRSAEPRVEGTA